MAVNKSGTPNSIMLSDYVFQIKGTDVLPESEINPILMGLYGEVGGIMSTAKKHVREKIAFPGYQRATEEEFGDALWYLEALCRRIGVELESLFHKVAEGDDFSGDFAASDIAPGAFSKIMIPKPSRQIDPALFELARATTALLEVKVKDSITESLLENFVRCYLHALHSSDLSFAVVVRRNIKKVRGAFLKPTISSLPMFDKDLDEEEQLPSEFRIRVSQRKNGRSYLRWNNVFIGDPLTDNISDPDGYRFHDVFHLANAAILHWSPVFRALIKQKRKSKPLYDETEDGGRAIVVEEGLTAWIFSRAKNLNFFEGQERVSLRILKTIQDFVTGYEVQDCPLQLWEQAILDGYKVFRSLRKAEEGWIVGSRINRTINFEPL